MGVRFKKNSVGKQARGETPNLWCDILMGNFDEIISHIVLEVYQEQFEGAQVYLLLLEWHQQILIR